MAKITAAERAEKLEFINQTIFELFLEQGWHAVNFPNIAKRTNMSASTIQSYHKADTFGEALIGRSFPYFIAQLDLSSLTRFEATWSLAMEDKGFCNIIMLLMNDTFLQSANNATIGGMDRFLNYVESELGKPGTELVECLLGRLLIKLTTGKGEILKPRQS